ncbi:MAG: outer membrane protein assembly factor BamD [Proteobacteria bacterium]|nr:outer membrane protein assembly factor BamD [Pseudomonadota bacterium]
MTPALRAVCCAAFLLLLSGCGGSDTPKAGAPGIPPAPVDVLYNHGIDALNAQRYQTAGDQFTSVEENYPYSEWATKAQLMLGYSQYLQQNYTGALDTIDRYIELHPASRDIAYAYYLRALCYYEQIEDVERDQDNTLKAIAALRQVVDRFPGTAYARDARLKIDLARDHLAGHELAIGLFYEHQHLYEAAIGRYQRVVEDFQTTNHVAEALHRLVEVYLRLGMRAQALRSAAVLGYNYPGSSWYADTYADLYNDKLVKGLPPPKGPGHGFLDRTFGWLF